MCEASANTVGSSAHPVFRVEYLRARLEVGVDEVVVVAGLRLYILHEKVAPPPRVPRRRRWLRL